jgi:hypothetical protein
MTQHALCSQLSLPRERCCDDDDPYPAMLTRLASMRRPAGSTREKKRNELR